MIPDAIEIRLSRKERAVLEAPLRAATTEQRIVLEAADGMGTREIARELETPPTRVSLWRAADGAQEASAPQGVSGLHGRSRGCVSEPAAGSHSLNTHKENEKWLKRHPNVSGYRGSFSRGRA
jgi:hypothetical protein